MRLCENEKNYRAIEHDGTLKSAVGAYAIGQRDTDTLDTLAKARVWSEGFGEWVPLPLGYDRTRWTNVLDDLVVARLGNRHCLDCSGFFSDHGIQACFIGTTGTVRSLQCPQCGSVVSEPIQCTEGVA